MKSLKNYEVNKRVKHNFITLFLLFVYDEESCLLLVNIVCFLADLNLMVMAKFCERFKNKQNEITSVNCKSRSLQTCDHFLL